MEGLKNIKDYSNFKEISEYGNNYNYYNYDAILDLARDLVRLGIASKFAKEYAEDYVTTKKSREALLNKLKSKNKKAFDYLYNKSSEMEYKGLLKGVDWE
jgi:ADP-heptose:LPS heptosyltransferase